MTKGLFKLSLSNMMATSYMSIYKIKFILWQIWLVEKTMTLSTKIFVGSTFSNLFVFVHVIILSLSHSFTYPLSYPISAQGEDWWYHTQNMVCSLEAGYVPAW